MTRMRKERPTMRIFGISVEGIKAQGSSSRTDDNGNPCYAVPHDAALDPIRCTMPVPCGVCWYCKQHEARNA